MLAPDDPNHPAHKPGRDPRGRALACPSRGLLGLGVIVTLALCLTSTGAVPALADRGAQNPTDGEAALEQAQNSAEQTDQSAVRDRSVGGNASQRRVTDTATPGARTATDEEAGGQEPDENDADVSLPPDVTAPPLSTEPNGVPLPAALSLFSRDEDGAGFNGGFYGQAADLAQRLDSDNETRVGLLISKYRQDDRLLSRPPAYADTWSQNSHQTLTAALTAADVRSHRFAVVPRGAETSDGQYLKDAHATIHALGPQTVIHGDRGTQRYIAPEGSVRGLVDYRVEKPEDYTQRFGRDTGIVRQTYEYEVLNHGIRSVSLNTDNGGSETEPGPFPAFDYTYARGESPGQFTLRATVRASIKTTVTTVRKVEQRGDFDDDNETETRTVRRVSTTETVSSETLTVDDSRNVEVYRLGGVSATYVPLPENPARNRPPRTALAIGSRTPWAGYSVPHERPYQREAVTDRVTTRWRFYTTADRDWTRLGFRAEGESVRVRSPPRTRPVVVHAVRVPNTLTAAPGAGDGGPRAVRALGRQRGASQGVNENVQVANRLERTYSVEKTIARHQDTVGPSENNPVRVYGVVAGVNRTIRVGEMDRREVSQPELSVEEVESEGRTTTLRVTLTDDGDPLALRESREPVAESGSLTPSGDLRRVLARNELTNDGVDNPSLSQNLAAQRVNVQNPDIEPFSPDRPAVVVTSFNTDTLVQVPLADLRDDGTATVTIKGGGGKFATAYYPRPWTEVPRQQPAYIMTYDGVAAYDLFELRDWGAGLFQILVWVFPYAIIYYTGKWVGQIFSLAEGPRR
jgi:hypothetical protein